MIPIRSCIIIHFPKRIPCSHRSYWLMRPSVHNRWQVHTVPVKRSAIHKHVVDVHMHRISAVNKQGWPPEIAIDSGGGSVYSGKELLGAIFHIEIELCSRKSIGNP